MEETQERAGARVLNTWKRSPAEARTQPESAGNLTYRIAYGKGSVKEKGPGVNMAGTAFFVAASWLSALLSTSLELFLALH